MNTQAYISILQGQAIPRIDESGQKHKTMDKQIVTTDFGDFVIEILPDNDPFNPRTDWDPLGTMICFHNRYNLGDAHKYGDSDEFLEILSGWDEEKDGEFNRVRAQEKINKTHVMLPLFLYDHSGITMSTGPFGCGWDSGQVGWIYMSMKDAEDQGWGDEWLNGRTLREAAKDILNGEVETYDQYLTGEVYGYEVIDPEGEELHSCWGFFGDPEESGLIEEATAIIESRVARLKKEELRQLEAEGLILYSERFNTIKP